MKLFEYRDRHVVVCSYGNEVSYDLERDDFSQAVRHVGLLAEKMGAQNALLQLVANDARGRFKILLRDQISRSPEQFVTLERDRVDGVILTGTGDAVAFMTRDCPTLVLYNTKREQFAILHISRNSVQGIDLGRPGESVIRNALRICLRMWDYPRPTTIRGVITAGISGLSFHNEQYPEIVEGLRRRWGERAIPWDLFHPINLRELILAQLAMYDIKRNQVVCDDLDTYSDPRLASKRAGKNGRHNLVIVLFKEKEKPNPRRGVL